ncbi:MAG TPA: ATP-binding protein [Bryobacteraceae bacterium]|nr:ATP-binding protein [Bryobacteraceae bacterium]
MTQSSSLRRKLITITSVGSLLTAIIAAAAFTYWDLKRFWEQTTVEVTALASVVGDQVGPAVTLNDAKAAAEILASLRSDGRIREAVLYTADGACFAAFRRAPAERCGPQGVDGIRMNSQAIVISRPITAAGERVGTIQLAANLPSVAAVLYQYLRGAGLIVVLKLLMAAILVAILQYHVARPILAIARTAQQMAESHNFGHRVPVESGDEVGVLASSFNTMVDEIVRRDAQLAEQRRRLEQEVVQRSLVNRELRQAKNKAEEAVRLKGEFLANMSHEIRTPLNGVTGMITLALDRCEDPEAREQLQLARNSAMSLTAILNDILDLSRVEAGKLKIESVPFNLRDMLRECLWIFDPAIREKRLSLTVNVAADCPERVLGDPIRLRQVLINLTGNAVKFTPDGEIRVAVSMPAPGTLRFDVRDTGIGIPQDKLGVIFEAFTQADGSHTRRFGGSGLGLTITKRLVGLMGGQITAQSEPGNGSLFSVVLPLAAAPAGESSLELRATVPTSTPAKLHVLVAEDNPINQKVAAGILSRKGWTVTVASTGQQAYQAFLTNRFDLILMDVQMPEVDGLEASTLIRDWEREHSLERTPIVAVTAHASSAQHEQCIAHGMDAVVTKPIDIAALFETIQRVISASQVPAA